MPKANLYDITGKQVGEVELAEAIFGIGPNETAVHAVVKNHLANCRQGTQSALTRAEVSGGGKKPWRQKGTSAPVTAAPATPSGPTAAWPSRPSPVPTLHPEQEAQAPGAQKASCLIRPPTMHLRGGGLDLPEIKTKSMKALLDTVEAGKSVVITRGVKQNVVLSARNLPASRPPPPTSCPSMTCSTPRAWLWIRQPWLLSRRFMRNDCL